MFFILFQINNTMKKTLLIALAGIMLLAFTQCGSESKEFKDSMALMEKMQKAIKEAGSCDDMQAAIFNIAMDAYYNEYYYADDEKLTSDEEAKLEELSKKLDELYTQKAKELGCEDEESSDDSSWEDLEDSLYDLSDSKEFKDMKALMEKMQKAIKEAGSCDEMQDALFDVFKEVTDKEYNYTDDEKITSGEEAKLEELSKKIDELFTQKAKELGCEDEE